MTPTVSQDSGTIKVPDAPVTEVKTEVKEEPKPKTLAETEQEYRESFDKKHGRDITKLFPVATPKKEEVKAEVKTAVKTEPAKEEPKKEEPAKPKSGFQRVMAKKNREIGELTERSRQLEARLQALEGGKPTSVTTKVVDEPKEPTKPIRSTFKTTEEYLDAYETYVEDARKYDREQLTKTTTSKITEQEQARLTEQATERWNLFVERRDELKKTLTDYDEVIDKSTVSFSPVLQGLIVDLGAEDPKFFYDMAKNPKGAKELNTLTEKAVAAIGSAADDLAGVMRHLVANPSDIAKINGLDNVKAAKFVGIIESKLEAAVKEPKTEEKVAPLPATSASPKAEEKPPVQAEPARRQRPEPPPKVNGSAPPPTDWKESQEMTLAERERLYREDPRNKRR